MDKYAEQILIAAISIKGVPRQLDKAVEELSELIKEICKFKYECNNRKALIDEIADVEIMLEQLKIIVNDRLEIKPEDIEIRKKYKINRLAESLGFERMV
ncbi:hypothetical protein [Ruminiclostridium papyrosolvens]|uniref:hypothetical protein n=1 Tax=Ruminiclostridium papyrosolvens TaxID=29362 RepID=UPI000405A4C8|nr:hypothetical protein [Ruminiclostridium papyrosolvens]